MIPSHCALVSPHPILFSALGRGGHGHGERGIFATPNRNRCPGVDKGMEKKGEKKNGMGNKEWRRKSEKSKRSKLKVEWKVLRNKIVFKRGARVTLSFTEGPRFSFSFTGVADLLLPTLEKSSNFFQKFNEKLQSSNKIFIFFLIFNEKFARF